MIAEWVKNYESRENTGVLFWDLSAAFDTLNIDILCKKLKIYGADDRSVNFIRSFLSNRRQQVQVGDKLSETKTTSIGCPQGSLLSPLLFLIYIADVDLWVREMKVRGYADDTASSVSSPDLDKVIKSLEADGERMLHFMASNDLVANPEKTGLLIIRTPGACRSERTV